MKKHAASHFDHGLTEAQVDFLMKQFADKTAFFIATIELPEQLGAVPCGLFGPIMGDAPIADADVTHAKRGAREWTSRLIDRAPRPSRRVTIIAGPHEEKCWHCDGTGGIGEWKARIPCGTCDHGKVKHACIVYTAFGGPLAPQEPGDVRAQIQVLERTRHAYNPEVTEAQEAEIHAKIVALREKRDQAVAFWGEHALAR